MTPEVGVSPPVIVVGAGPVGMSAALFLAGHGVPVVVLERRVEPSTHPKARGVRLRTMELFRQFGIEQQLRANALPPEARRFIYCDTLAGQEIARSPSVGVEEDEFSPTNSVRVAQDSVEAALRSRIEQTPLTRVLPGHEVVALAQDPAGVTLTVRNPSGSTQEMRSPYVIAADGVGSVVRRSLGVAMAGVPVIAYWQSVYWHGDIDRWAADRPCIQFMTGARIGQPATVASVDGRRRWITMITAPPGSETPQPISFEAAARAVRAAVGEPALPVEVLDVATWRLSATVADRWNNERIFLAGDAAHSFPPTGGFGMNTGVQDVHNLAWKLALVLAGRASPELLETYERERRPVAQANADWSVANGARVRDITAAIRAGDDSLLQQLLGDQREHLSALQQDLGYTYGAVASASEVTFKPAVAVGRRAPHAWVWRAGSRLSTVDLLLGSQFSLLCSAPGAGWRHAAAELDFDGPPVTVYDVGVDEDLVPEQLFDTLFQLSDGAVLVRPDGHVAARIPGGPDGAALKAELTRWS